MVNEIGGEDMIKKIPHKTKLFHSRNQLVSENEHIGKDK